MAQAARGAQPDRTTTTRSIRRPGDQDGRRRNPRYVRRPARAVRCAAAIRDGVTELGLQLRVGLHTGEIELQPNDIAGVAVHVGARISALARAGEILVSGTVKDLVIGSGLVFEERGTRELRGVPGEWRIFAAML